MNDSGTMAGRVVLVTGGTSGIGYVTALELARRGAAVIILCRSHDKGLTVQAQIREQTGAVVDFVVADLAQLSDVRRAARALLARYPAIHVLLNNAGAMNSQRHVTPEGFETTFAANYLGPFLLTQLLLERLTDSAPARIINVSSAAHAGARIAFDNLDGARGYRAFRAYGQSKLAQLYFTYELAERLDGTGVTVNACHPGFVATNFNHATTGVFHWLGWLAYALGGISAEKGAETSLYLASSPDVSAVTGKYFVNCREVPSSPRSYDAAVRRRLWALSCDLVSLPEEGGASGKA